jgi:hypothetical protein
MSYHDRGSTAQNSMHTPQLALPAFNPHGIFPHLIAPQHVAIHPEGENPGFCVPPPVMRAGRQVYRPTSGAVRQPQFFNHRLTGRSQYSQMEGLPAGTPLSIYPTGSIPQQAPARKVHQHYSLTRKRNPLACKRCRKRKIRCDGQVGEDCGECNRSGSPCEYQRVGGAPIEINSIHNRLSNASGPNSLLPPTGSTQWTSAFPSHGPEHCSSYIMPTPASQRVPPLLYNNHGLYVRGPSSGHSSFAPYSDAKIGA